MKGRRFVNKFVEKIVVWTNGPFWAQKWHMLVTLGPL